MLVSLTLYIILFLFTIRVGDEALIAVSQCSSLQFLNVSGCHQIGDAGLIAIARGCPELTYLDVSVLQVCSLFSLFVHPHHAPAQATCAHGNYIMLFHVFYFWQVEFLHSCYFGVV